MLLRGVTREGLVVLKLIDHPPLIPDSPRAHPEFCGRPRHAIAKNGVAELHAHGAARPGGAAASRSSPRLISRSVPMRFRGGLAGSYPGAVALVILALTPYLVLTGALLPMQMLLQKGTGLSSAGLQLSDGMANAAYCLGTVVAVQLTTRLNGHRLLIGFAGLFTLARRRGAGNRVPGPGQAGGSLALTVAGLASSFAGAFPPGRVG
jgi:hypothetical protein